MDAPEFTRCAPKSGDPSVMITKGVINQMKFIKLIITTLFFVCQPIYAQDFISLDTTEQNPKYESITEVSVGPFGYDKKNPRSFPYRYRAIVSTFEIYDYLHIEKLKTNNEEGITKGIEWSRRVYLQKLLKSLKIPSEQQNIKEINWRTPISFYFKIGGHRVLVEDVTLPVLKVFPAN